MHKPRAFRAACIGFLAILSESSQALEDAEFAALAKQCAPWIAPQTIAAIVKTESKFKPFAIGVNGGNQLERQPASKEEAVVTAKWLLAQGYNIDLGYGQVNSSNLQKTKLTVEDAFDSCKNLAAAATILQWNYEQASEQGKDQQATMQTAISLYNTGSTTKGFANGYVQKVIDNTASPQGVEVATVQPIPLTIKRGQTQAKAAQPTPLILGPQTVQFEAPNPTPAPDATQAAATAPAQPPVQLTAERPAQAQAQQAGPSPYVYGAPDTASAMVY